MRAPAVSVITPAFNAEPFIRETIESVLRQTWGDLELIVVDDCSTDGTASILAEFAKRDSRVRLLRTPRNSGQWAARNLALEAARGRLFAFLDSDDLWDADKLARQVPFAENSEGALTFTAYRVISESGEVQGHVAAAPARISYTEMLAGHRVGCLTVMLERARLGVPRFGPFPGTEDLALWLALLRTRTVASGLDVELASYRIREGSVSRNKWRYARQVWGVYAAQPIPITRKVHFYCLYGARGLRKHVASGALGR